MADVLRVGVIGTGMGRLHLDAYGKAPDVELAALCDLNEQEAREIAGKFGVKEVYTDYKQMLEREGLDVVSVAVPNDLHAAMTVEALRAGAHVLCEKPMATNVKDASGMVEEARRQKKLLMVHMNQRFAKESRVLHEYASGGDLGEIYHGKASWLRRRGTPVLDFPQDGTMGRGDWFVQKKHAGGGALMDIGVHLYDICWWLMGCPTPAAVRGQTYFKLRKEEFKKLGIPADVDEFATAFVTFENKATMHLEVSWSLNAEPGRAVQVFGTRGGASTNPFKIIAASHDRAADIVPEVGRTEVFETAQEHFVSCIRDPSKRLIASGEEGLEVIRVLEAIQKSSKRGKEVRIERNEHA